MKRSRLSVSSSEDEDLPVKRPASHWLEQGGSSSSHGPSDIGQRLMAKMGYKSGSGLGRLGQGRVNPVELSTQRGRRGLGLKLEGLEPSDIEWDSKQEVVCVEEAVSWLEEECHVQVELAQLRAWMKEGPPKRTLDDETLFCDPDVVRNVLSSKSVFDRLDKHELMKARTRSNPFETIGKGIFLNRAAMKMANMDAVFDFMFTNPQRIESHPDHPIPMVGPKDLLYFADVCAGPGGFSEYVLWRCKWEAKGFGMTLRDSNDFRLEDFYAAPCETFEPYYGVKEDGNVYKPENIESLQRYVMEHTFGYGVHFMMADGGFSVDGQENIQEILSKQLYLCQCLVALSIVRTQGHFVVKLFDLFTPFSVGLIYLMYKAFHKIAIHKPNTSRPANSERYLICKWKRDNTSSIRDYLFEVNAKLNKSSSTKDVVELVPVEVLREDVPFYNYIVESNNLLGERQIVNLVKIKAYCQNTNLNEFKQADMKKECLAFWRVPDQTRTAPKMKGAEDKVQNLVGKPTWLTSEHRELNKQILNNEFNLYDWRCVVLEKSSSLTFYVGLGRGHVYSWDRDRSRWYRARDLELSPDTLVYAELVWELKGDGRSQVKRQVFHVVDAVFLGGKDVRSMHLKDRLETCEKFALALNKSTRPELTQIRVKQLFRPEEMDLLFDRLDQRSVKSQSGRINLSFVLAGQDETFFLPAGLLFFKATLDPWTMQYSRSQRRKYWFNTKTGVSTFSCPPNSNMDFAQSFERRVWWGWNEGVSLLPNPDTAKLPENKVHRCDVVSRMHSLMPR